MKESVLPTAAELKAAVKADRLMEVVLPTGQKIGDIIADVPEDNVSLETVMIPLGKKLGDCTQSDLLQLADFYGGLSEAMKIHGAILFKKRLSSGRL